MSIAFLSGIATGEGMLKVEISIAALAWPLFAPLLFAQSTTQIYPRNQAIAPFGYGAVTQVLTRTNTEVGSADCAKINKYLNCIEVSGGNTCSAPAPAASIVSCAFTQPGAVDETKFQPVNCNGHGLGDGGVSGLLGSIDFCLFANYMPTRTQDTLYLFDDYVRLGINTFFGGTVFELYGADKIDRILQNGGGAIQLSLWAFNIQYALQEYPRAYFAIPNPQNPKSCDPTAYPDQASCQSANPYSSCTIDVDGPNVADCITEIPCAGNGQTAGSPINPIQATSEGCSYGLQSGQVDSITSNNYGQIAVTKSAPYNYTRSNNMPTLNWSETAQVIGPYAELTYKAKNNLNLDDTDFQEIPAIYMHQGIGTYFYYYTGSSPYKDASGPVTRVTSYQGMLGAYQLPGRQGPFGVGSVAGLTEDWMSSCDQTETKCMTVATFSSLSQDIIAGDDENSSYFGIHGFFSLTNNMNMIARVFVFPYRFDDIVMGKSIRQWIYGLSHNGMNRR